jgi:hypothetical protein
MRLRFAHSTGLASHDAGPAPPLLDLGWQAMSALQAPSRRARATAVRPSAWERRTLLGMVGLCSVLAGWLAPVDGAAGLVLLAAAGAGAVRYVRAAGEGD